MPQYNPTKEEIKYRTYCIRNEIRIYPIGIENDNEHWKIGVNIGPYQRGEKQNISPSIYDKHSVWPEYYRMCKYYYDKRIRKEI